MQLHYPLLGDLNKSHRLISVQPHARAHQPHSVVVLAARAHVGRIPLESPGGGAVVAAEESPRLLLITDVVLEDADLLAVNLPQEQAVTVRRQHKRGPLVVSGSTRGSQLGGHPSGEFVVDALERVLGNVVAGGNGELYHINQWLGAWV